MIYHTSFSSSLLTLLLAYDSVFSYSLFLVLLLGFFLDILIFAAWARIRVIIFIRLYSNLVELYDPSFLELLFGYSIFFLSIINEVDDEA